MCLKSSFVYKINVYRVTSTFKKMLSFEVDSLEGNLYLGPFLAQCCFPKECCLSKSSKKACQKMWFKEAIKWYWPSNLLLCVCVCVYDREWEREIGGGGERGERIRCEIIISILITIVFNLHVTVSSTLPA